jgi:deoxyribonuclease-1
MTIQWVGLVPAKYYLSHQMCFMEKLCIDNKGQRFSGIRCCRKRDPLFHQFENDLHHLVPELPILKRTLQTLCEPEDKLKGSIARMFLYMQLKYKIMLPASEKMQYENWHRKYPPTEWERKRNQLIRNVQGDGNPYIENGPAR